MFNLSDITTKILTLAERFFTDPTHASRVVVSGFLAIGVMAAGINSGDLASSLLSARLVDPVTTADIQKIKNNTANGEQKNCTYDVGKAKAVLDGFENSFRGILPGAGKLLDEHVTTVAERKEKMILEVMTRYGQYKYCIDPLEMKVAIGTNSFSQFNLSAYSAITLGPKSNAAAIDSSDLITADISQTYTYISGIVKNAIAAAKDIDHQTELRLSSLGSQTNADLAARDLGIANSANAIGNIQTQVLGEISNILYDHTELLADSSKLLDKLANTKAYEHTKKSPCSSGGGGFGGGSFGGVASAGVSTYTAYNPAAGAALSAAGSLSAANGGGTSGGIVNLANSNSVIGTDGGEGKGACDEVGKFSFDSGLFLNPVIASRARGKPFAQPNVGKQVETLLAPQAGLKAAADATDKLRTEADASVGSGSVSDTKDPAFTYGLLNLVKSEDREKFLATRLDVELKIYTATRMFINPLTPGSGLMNSTKIIEMPEIQVCSAIDNPDGSDACFGVTKN